MRVPRKNKSVNTQLANELRDICESTLDALNQGQEPTVETVRQIAFSLALAGWSIGWPEAVMAGATDGQATGWSIMTDVVLDNTKLEGSA